MARDDKTPKYTEGRLYLRDTRNGTIHEYQPLLGEMGYMQRFIYGEESATTEPLKATGSLLSAEERAAEFDRRAGLTEDQRNAEDAETDKARAEQDKANAVVPGDAAQPKYTMTAKADKATYEDFVKQGWKDEQLVEQGYMVEAK